MINLPEIIGAFICKVLLFGLLLSLLIFGIPAYFIGKHFGKQEAYTEAMQHKVLDIKYNKDNGEKQFIWVIK